MLVKFTNLNRDHLDQPVYINALHILTVYESRRSGPDGGFTTTIYCMNEKEWFVEESLSQAVKMINEALGNKNAKCANCSCK